MGVSRSPLQLAEKMAVAAVEVGEIPAIATKAAGEAAAALIRAVAPARLRNVGKKGAALNVVVTSWSAPGGAKGIVKPHPAGPWSIIEFDTKAHTIPKERKRGRRRAVRMPDGQVRSTVHHPGTKGKHPFEKGAAAAVPLIPGFYQEATTVALGRVF